jgi:flagellar hook-associated protein 3 FlgL
MGAIRVNPNPLPDLLSALNDLEQRANTANLQLATGSRINAPSDDPAGAAQLVQISSESSQTDSFQRSISSINGQLSAADSTLSSVVIALQRAISLGVEGANGTLSDSDRIDVAAELTEIQNQLVSLANTSYNGQYIFAGTATTQPFALDSSQPSGVLYSGNTGVNQVAIGNGYQLQVNQPGSQVFSGAGGDVFQSIQDLIFSLKANFGIGDAVNEVGKAFRYVTAQRVFYGNGLNQTQAQQTYLGAAKLDLTQQQDTVASADPATVATDYTRDVTALNATLAAIGRFPQTSLFDYLK